MPGNIFGGGFFGKPVPLAGAPRQGPLPVVPPAQAMPQQQPPALGVVPAPAATPKPAMGPQGPVPMGQKKDCPVCRG